MIDQEIKSEIKHISDYCFTIFSRLLKLAPLQRTRMLMYRRVVYITRNMGSGIGYQKIPSTGNTTREESCSYAAAVGGTVRYG